jgi:IS5 family transposase
MPPSATRLISMHDPDARTIAKGRLGKPLEFGYKAQVVDNIDGIIVDHSVYLGNPPDAPMLAPAIERIKQLFGRAPRAATADRGYGEAKIDEALEDLGVKNVVIPRKGKPNAERRTKEHSAGFRRLVKWRTGSEGRISYMKRRYGWDRTLLDGLDGATTWCGLGVLAHNAVKIAVLIETKNRLDTEKPGDTNNRKSRTDPNQPAAGPPPGPPPTLETAA